MPAQKLEPDFTVAEVAEALRMSQRWVRDQYRLHGAAHQRYGRVVRFTADQVEQLRERCSAGKAAAASEGAPAPTRVTTGPTKFARVS